MNNNHPSLRFSIQSASTELTFKNYRFFWGTEIEILSKECNFRVSANSSEETAHNASVRT